MSTAQEVIKNFMKSLDNTTSSGTAALDEAVKSVSKFSSWSELTKTMIKDCQAYNGDYANFLKVACNIVLDNEDTGAISGSDAGTSTTKSAESVVPESGSITYPTTNTFTIQGLTVTVPKLDTLSDDEKFIVGALYTWWVDSSLTLIKDSFGMNFQEAGTTVKELDIQFYDNDSDGRMAYTSYSTTQKCTELHMKINLHYFEGIDTTNPNGVGNSSALTYLDRTIAHEMVHAVMAANVDYFNDLPTSFKEGIAELVHGIDDKRRDRIQNLATLHTSLQSALNGSGTNSYAAGYMALRYLAKQAATGRNPSDDIVVSTSSDTSTTGIITPSTDTSSTSTTTTVSGSATFSGTTLNVVGEFTEDIWLSTMDLVRNTVSHYANVDTLTIDATNLTSRIILAGNDNNNTIRSGRNGASIWGGAHGDDVLVGGDSRDMFWYSAGGGSDEILNFRGGTADESDVLTVMDNFSVNRSDGNLNFNMDDGGNLSVYVGTNVAQSIQYSADGKNVIKVKVGNTNSENNFTYQSDMYYLGGNGIDTLSVDDSVGSASIFLTDSHFANINVIDAKNSSAQNVLAGNNLDNEIIVGAGNCSLWGGESGSNDTLTGGDGSNMFWYGLGEGNDVVENANGDDVIFLYNISLGEINSFEDIQNGVKLNFSAGSLTVNGEGSSVRLGDGSSYRYDKNSLSWV